MKKLILSLFLLSCIFHLSCSSDDAAGNTFQTTASRATVTNYKVVGYFPDYKSYGTEKIQFNKLTHINYAFAIPTTAGTLRPLENPGTLDAIVREAHASGVKVLIAVGGWQYNNTPLDATFETLAASDTGRNALIQNLLTFVADYNLDGVDIDWEFPDPALEGNGSADNFSRLMRDLGGQLHARGKLLTAAVHAGASVDVTDFYWAKGVQSDVFEYVDFLNLMAYDGGDGAYHSPYLLAQNSLNYWVNIRGLAGEKAILGVPFYGRPSWKSYAELVAEDPSAPTKDIVNGVYYNGIDTIKQKTRLAMEQGGGIMIWELTHDTMDSTSLLNAVYTEMGGAIEDDDDDDDDDNNNDTTPPSVPGGLTLIQTTANSVTISWNASSDDSGSVAGYVVYVNNAALLNVSSTGTTVTGLASAAAYTISVSAYDAGGNESDKSSAINVTTDDQGTVTGSKNIVGYFCEWSIYAAHDYFEVSKIPFEKLTHINYAFVGINDDYTVKVLDSWATLEKVFSGEAWDTPYKGNLGQLRKYKQQYPHIKTLISVGGWTKSSKFHDMAMTQSGRQTFADSCVAFIREHEMDGVDIDWEYPGIDRPKDPNDVYDEGCPGGPEDTENYTLLMKTLRETLDAAAGEDGKDHYLLTAAVGIGYDKIALTEPEKYSQYLDFINLMTYDMHGGFESVIGHMAPLYKNPNDPHDPEIVEKYNCDWAVKKFLSLGVPASKINMGLPFYARGWNNVSGGTNGMFGTGGSTLSGLWGIGGQSPYYHIKTIESDPAFVKYRDEYSMVPWLYSASRGELYTYDDDISISVKCDYINTNKLGGAMYWEIDGDCQNTLMTIVFEKMSEEVPADTEPPSKPANVQCPGKTATTVQLSWDPSTDNVGVTAYDVLEGASIITSVSGTSCVITGLAAETTYTFSIVAKDAAGNVSAASDEAVVTTNADTGDTIPPTNPSGLVVSSKTAASVSLSWSASTDNVGVEAYTVYSGFQLAGTTAQTAYVVTGLSAATTYTFTVKARDAAGNVSGSSNQVSVTTDSGSTCIYPVWVKDTVYTGGDIVHYAGHDWKALWWTLGEEPGVTASGVWEDLGECSGTDEKTPPTAVITSPLANSSYVPGADIVISVDAADTDGTVKQVEFFQNNLSLGIDTTSPYTLTWENVQSGTYAITAIATDNDNLQGSSGEITIAVTGDTSADTWLPGQYYEVGAVVTYNGKVWENTYAHTSNEAWYPGAEGLWFWVEIN